MKIIPYFICSVQGEDDHNLDTWMRFFFNKDTNGDWEEAYDIGIDKGLNDDEALADMRKAFEMHKESITNAAKGRAPSFDGVDDPEFDDEQDEWEIVDTWDASLESGNYTAVLYLAYKLTEE